MSAQHRDNLLRSRLQLGSSAGFQVHPDVRPPLEIVHEGASHSYESYNQASWSVGRKRATAIDPIEWGFSTIRCKPVDRENYTSPLGFRVDKAYEGLARLPGRPMRTNWKGLLSTDDRPTVARAGIRDVIAIGQSAPPVLPPGLRTGVYKVSLADSANDIVLRRPGPRFRPSIVQSDPTNH